MHDWAIRVLSISKDNDMHFAILCPHNLSAAEDTQIIENVCFIYSWKWQQLNLSHTFNVYN
jgi:hypothetical protein